MSFRVRSHEQAHRKISINMIWAMCLWASFNLIRGVGYGSFTSDLAQTQNSLSLSASTRQLFVWSAPSTERGTARAHDPSSWASFLDPQLDAGARFNFAVSR